MKKKDSGEKKGNTRKYYFNTCTNQYTCVQVVDDTFPLLTFLCGDNIVRGAIIVVVQSSVTWNPCYAYSTESLLCLPQNCTKYHMREYGTKTTQYALECHKTLEKLSVKFVTSWANLTELRNDTWSLVRSHM